MIRILHPLSRAFGAGLAALLLPTMLTAQVVMETFRNTTAPGWTLVGSGFTPILTANGSDGPGNGWLRLTSNGNYQRGSAYYDTPFAAANATIFASFDFNSWGGNGADGITFFLYDGSKTFGLGADGGSLGYAQKTGVDGMNGGYLGVAVDEYGNFSNPTEGRVGGIGFTPDSFSVRGPGQGTTGYDYLGGTSSLPTSIDQPNATTRPTGINTVQILISPTNQLTLTLQQGGASAQTVLSLDLSGYARPETLNFGFSASTGGLNNYHEIRNLNVTTLVANLWDGGAANGLWSSGTNWNPDIMPAAGADILLDNTFASTAQAINTEANRTVRSLQFDAPFAYTLNNNTVTFDAGAVPGFSGIAVTQTRGAATHTINSNLALANDIGIRNNSAGALNLTGTINLGNKTAAFDGYGTTTATGVISGTGNLTKSESGTVNLNAANTYSGGTTVMGGTLATNNDTGFGTGTITLTGGTIASTDNNTIGNIITLAGSGGISGLTATGNLTQSGGNYTLALDNATLGNVALSENNTGRTLTTNVAGTSVISGIISNGGTVAGNLTKTGFGTLELGGNNTYTGTTTINAGTLQLGASDRLDNASDVNIAGGTLNLNTFSEQVDLLNFSNSGTLDFGTQGNANNFLFANTTGTPSGVLTVANWESGTDILASSTALTTTVLDQLYFVGYGSGATQTDTTTVSGYSGNWRPIDPNVSGWNTWDSGNNSNRWDRAANWVGDVVPVWGTSTKIAFGTGNQTTTDMRANRTVNAIRFDEGSASFNLTGTGDTLTMSGPNAGSVAFIQQQSANNQTMSMTTISLARNTVVDMIGTGNLTISSALTGSSSLVKENTGGTLILSGNSTAYTGNIFVNAGTLQANSANALGTTAGTTTILDGGTLAFSGTFTSAENITATGAGVGGAGAIQAVNGTTTLSGAITMSGATTLAATAGNTLTLSNTATGVTGAHELTFAGAGNINAARISSGLAGVTVNSTGTVTYNGGTTANTYTGTTTVNSGTLVLGKTAGTNAIAGNLVIGDGTGTDTVRLGAANQIVDTAAVTLNSSGVLDLNSFTENVARLTGTAGASVTLSTTGNLGIIGAGDSVYAGTITGGAGSALNKSGTGKLTLSGDNSDFAGAVGLSAGILNVSGTNANILGTGTVSITGTGNLEMQGGTTLGNAMTLNSLGTGSMDGAIQNVAGSNTVSGNLTLAGNSRIQSDAGTLTVSGTTNLAANNLNVGGSGSTAMNGAISGTGSLTKDGSGTLTLGTANSFTGATTISSGTIIAAANDVINNAALLTIGNGATFDLDSFTATAGALAGTGNLDFGAGGQLSLSGTGTFSGSFLGSGTLILEAGSTLTLGANFNAPNLSIVLAGGTLDLGGYTSSFGNLSITTDSVINFSGNSTLTVADILSGPNTTLNIQNWADTLDYFYSNAWTGATADSRGSAPVNQVVFNGFTGSNTVWQAYDNQITPVPEPSTYGAILIGTGLAFLGYRRWRRRGAVT